MEDEKYTLEQARMLMGFEEKIVKSETLFSMLAGLPFLILLLTYVVTYTHMMDVFVSQEMRLIALIVFVFGLVRLASWVKGGKIITKYVETKK